MTIFGLHKENPYNLSLTQIRPLTATLGNDVLPLRMLYMMSEYLYDSNLVFWLTLDKEVKVDTEISG